MPTGNDQIRFKPRPVEGTQPSLDAVPDLLLLDGQQRLTSLTQALTGNGVVSTTDTRGKLLDRRYYVDMQVALLGEDRIDEAVFGVPSDGVVRTDSVARSSLTSRHPSRNEGMATSHCACSLSLARR